MTRKNVPESEQKLRILLALRCLGGVTQLQLLRFMVEEDVMNYFVLQLNLCELEEMGQVRVCHHALGSLYELTEQGRYTLDSFDSHIPASRRQALEAGAARWKAQFRAEQQNQADAIPMKGGRQCLRLRMLEGDSALLDLSLTVERHVTEGELRKRWQGAAQAVYTTVTRALSEGYTENGPMPPLPATALLQQIGEKDWMLSLTDNLAEPTLNLMLSLPTEALARHYGARWPEKRVTLSAEILRALEGT